MILARVSYRQLPGQRLDVLLEAQHRLVVAAFHSVLAPALVGWRLLGAFRNVQLVVDRGEALNAKLARPCVARRRSACGLLGQFRIVVDGPKLAVERPGVSATPLPSCGA